MKPTVAVDEMFPEGAGGQFMDLEEVNTNYLFSSYFLISHKLFY